MSARPRPGLRQPRALRRLWLLLVPVCALVMMGWLRAGYPASPRGEGVAQISYLWLLRRLWQSGDALGGWNPLLMGGEPTATARVYHLHASLAGFSLLTGVAPEPLFKAVQILATLAGALGCHVVSVRLGVSRPASLIAGVAYAWLPIRVMLTVESLFAALAAACAPWLILGYELTRLPGPAPRREAALWGGLAALAVLCGPQRFLVMVAPLAAYVVLSELFHPVARGFGPGLRRFAVVIAIAGVTALGLSLFHTLPSLVEADLLWTGRYLEAWPRTARWRVDPSLVVSLFRLRWSSGFDAYGWDAIGIFPNIAYYAGGALCLLAIIGLTDGRRWRESLPLASMAIVSLLLALGPHVPVNPAYALVRRLPILADTVRNAFRYLLPLGISLCLLAAQGVDRFLEGTRSSRTQMIVALVAVALVVLDFWPVTQAYAVTNAYLEQETVDLHERLDALSGDERIWVPFFLKRPGIHYADTSYGQRYSRRASINDNEYHSPSAPYGASLLYRDGLRGQLEDDQPLDASAEAILDLASVRYLILPQEPELYHEATDLLAERAEWSVIQDGPTVALLENTDSLPLAHAYAQGVVIHDLEDEALLDALPALVVKGVALVEAPGRADLIEAGLDDMCRVIELPELVNTSAVPRPSVELALARPSANEIWIQYRSEAPFLLMLSENWYPHWRVAVNGERQSLLKLNGAYLGAVVADPGDGTVMFRYREPWYAWLAHVVSLAGLIAVAVVLTKPGPVRLRHDV